MLVLYACTSSSIVMYTRYGRTECLRRAQDPRLSALKMGKIMTVHPSEIGILELERATGACELPVRDGGMNCVLCTQCTYCQLSVQCQCRQCAGGGECGVGYWYRCGGAGSRRPPAERCPTRAAPKSGFSQRSALVDVEHTVYKEL